MPYLEVQSSVDELLPHGGRYFMKSHGMDVLSNEAIDTLLAWDARRPTPQTLTAIRTMGGKVGRVGLDESAYPHRGDRFNVSIDAAWTDPAGDAAAIAWARGAWSALEPFANGGVYVNFSGLDDEPDASRDRIFAASREHLTAVRATYDPQGVFEGAAHRP